MATTPTQTFRAPDSLWTDAQDALDAIGGPVDVMVSLSAGMDRSAAIRAFLAAVAGH